MRITIGILAYNEERNIARTLDSLLAQSVFTGPKAPLLDVQWEILVVPNGCRDRTAEVAHGHLTQKVGALARGNVAFRVEALQQPGKSNAWNELIHRFAAQDTDMFVLMDADIEFGHPDTIHNSVTTLQQNQHARVVVDLPLKDFTRKTSMGVLERLSARVSKMNLEGSVGISGQFYCAWGAFLRQVWMPVGLSVEDGFLAAMAATDCFRTQPDRTRICRAPDATHYFEGLTKPSQILHHEVRIVVGSVLNSLLCWDALLFLTPSEGSGAGDLVRDLNVQKPDWYRSMMMNQVRIRGYWVVPFSWLIRRLRFSKERSVMKEITTFPVRFLAFLFDAVVFLRANSKLRSDAAIGLW